MEAKILHYSMVFLLVMVPGMVKGQPQVPCYFIFGDSLVDSGNNNPLKTAAKVNYQPYGIDFPRGPTGRFTNGRTVVDIIGERLGLEDYIPPFATANDTQILKGVNYASGGSGILDNTGENQGEHIGLNKQLENHGATIARITKVLGNGRLANDLLNKCLYSVYIGSNDYINNYFMPKFFNTSTIYSPQQYADLLAKQYSQQLRKLYQQGARKISVAGLSLVGCTPNATSYYETKGALCVDKINDAVALFNAALRPLVDQLNKDLPDAKFILINTLKLSSRIDPSVGADINLIKSCCTVGDFGLCDPSKPLCDDRNKFIFFDSFHPTEIANRIQAERTFINTDQSEIYPMDIRTLASTHARSSAAA